MKVYLAARYGRYLEMQHYAAQVREAGHEVISSWIDGHDSQKDSDVNYWHLFAERDLSEIDTCDIFLTFSENPKQGFPRGGRHVELGYAIAKGKWVIICGPAENVFHELVNDNVSRYDEWEDALMDLESMEGEYHNG